MDMLDQHEGDCAVRLARQAIARALAGDAGAPPPLPDSFREKRGVFVTLTESGELRGCIGIPYPVKPLDEAIREAAVSAATGDPRFPPLGRGELSRIRVEVTVLTPPEPLTCPPEDRPHHITPGRHGLIVSGPMGAGLLLPQVAEEYGWDAREFLDHTCMKAGMRPGCWEDGRVEVSIFEGEIFGEAQDSS